LRAGWPYMEADTRDSPPFRGVDGWEGQRACGTPAECGPVPAPGRAGCGPR
jgi:hypothetical protein